MKPANAKTATHTATVQENGDGDLFIAFPESLVEELGWAVGDSLQWTDNEDGSFSVKKAEAATDASGGATP